jgi:hypothetical protein
MHRRRRLELRRRDRAAITQKQIAAPAQVISLSGDFVCML